MHVIDPPSPIDHTEYVGTAVIVNDTPLADTVTDRAAHADAGVQAHSGSPTNWGALASGDNVTWGGGTARRAYASSTTDFVDAAGAACATGTNLIAGPSE